MFKKLIVATAILAASSSIYASGSPYVGGSLGLINNSSNGGHTSYRGIDGNVSLGYGATIAPNFYLAGEAFVVPGSISIADTNATKTTWGVGASIIPGVKFSDKTIGYARVGVIDSHFSSQDENAVGGQVGLGMQTNVCQNWDVRGEYVYTKYKDVGWVSSPNSDAFNVGLVYKFE